MMDFSGMLIFITTLVLIFSPSAYSQSPPPPMLTPTPAPAPSPGCGNLTNLLTVAGPYGTFLRLLQSTKVITTLQNQANDTDQGLTLFVPKDSAFAALTNPSLQNLTQDQLKSICLFHALSEYYSLASFTTLSQKDPVSTMAGGPYTLNFTDTMGSISISSGWTSTQVSSAVCSTNPVAIYQVDKVLLPEAIYGTNIPPPPPPAPTPYIAPTSDTVGVGNGSSSSTTSKPSASFRIVGFSGWSRIVLAVSGGIVLLL